jgi:preprotein translocase subunit SecE
MNKLLTYYRLSKEEIYKVIFPTREQVRTGYISVILVVTVVTLFLALVDLALSGVISGILG